MFSKKTIFCIILLSISCAIIIYYLKDPNAIHQEHSLQAPSATFILGTDYLGRDLFSRLFFGILQSISIGLIVLIIVAIISIFLGGLSGYIKGPLDYGIVFFADLLSSIPSMILCLVFVGFFANSVWSVTVALIISWLGKYIRYIRNLVISLQKEDFITLAPLHGSTGLHTLMVHLLPNLAYPLLALFITDIGKIILSVSGLAFLGLGIQPPTAELGTILYDGKAYFFIAPWLFIFPGICLTVLILMSQLLGRKLMQWYQT
ncbi:ABC transporter permease [Streptococcus pluranimalium]